LVRHENESARSGLAIIDVQEPVLSPESGAGFETFVVVFRIPFRKMSLRLWDDTVRYAESTNLLTESFFDSFTYDYDVPWCWIKVLQHGSDIVFPRVSNNPFSNAILLFIYSNDAGIKEPDPMPLEILKQLGLTFHPLVELGSRFSKN
jgi:hypothetical protein